MKRVLHTHFRAIFPFILLCTLILASSLNGWGQTPGLIIKPSTGAGAAVLDPNGDGYVSQKTGGVQLGFSLSVNNDVLQSEIPYVALIRPDPLDDILRGPVGGFCEIVGIDAAGNNAISVYNDGTNLLFRFRLGGYAPNSKSYSILMDTDQKFGFTGVNADLNPVNGNPGFEVEVVLKTNFTVDVYNVNGLAKGILSMSHPYDTHCQKSKAVTMVGSGAGDPDYFYDFYIPLSDFTTPNLASLGITSDTKFRIVAVTTMNHKAAIGNNALSDIGGVTSGKNIDQIFTDLIEAQTPTVRQDCRFVIYISGRSFVKTQVQGYVLSLIIRPTPRVHGNRFVSSIHLNEQSL